MIKTFSTLLVAAAVQSAEVGSDQTCTALVMSGGGSNLAWEAGVLWGLLHYGDPENYRYDVTTGVSAGAINSAAIAGWDIGKELEATEWLSDQINEITTNDIYQNWFGGVAEGLFKHGLYDNSPSLPTLQRIIGQLDGFKRRVQVNAVDANTGDEHAMTEMNTSWEDFPQAVLSSASVPAIWGPQHFQDKILMDGMTAWNTNVDAAIQRCFEITQDPTKITVDVLVCGVTKIEEKDVENSKTLDNWFRAREINKDINSGNSIVQSMRAHPGVNFRHKFEENNGASGLSEINFDSKVTWPLQEAGREDAKNQLDQMGLLKSNLDEMLALEIPQSFLQ